MQRKLWLTLTFLVVVLHACQSFFPLADKYSKSDNHSLATQNTSSKNKSRKQQQKENIKNLLARGEGVRIFPHRANSVGKLKDLWQNGYRAFELDVFYTDGKDCLAIGHDRDHMSDTCLIDFFSHIPNANQLKRVWLDVKNLHTVNLKKMLARLKQIAKKWNYKEEFIFETDMQEEDLKHISQAGYHTSYYLPTRSIIDLLQKNDQQSLRKMAIRLARQVTEQEVHAVSFDERLYPFTKNYLESHLPTSYVYHTWVATDYRGYPYSLHDKLGDSGFLANMRSKKYYSDQRVKTILVHYESDFHL